MSPKEMYNKWIPGVTLLFSVIAFFVAIYRTDAKEYEIKLEEKADIKYVDDQVSAVKKEVSIQNEWIIKTLDRIDKRTERLEDKIR